MSNYIDILQEKTRWDDIPKTNNDFRLLCNDPECSLSCANIRNGKLSVTSIHGDERHSQILTKNDMAFITLKFLESLNEEELRTFCHIFNKISPTFLLTFKKL